MEEEVWNGGLKSRNLVLFGEEGDEVVKATVDE